MRLVLPDGLPFPARCPLCQGDWTTGGATAVMDPRPTYSKDGYVVTIYCAQRHGCERRLAGKDFAAFRDAMALGGPHHRTREAGKSPSDRMPKLLRAADVDPRLMYVWAQDSLPGTPFSPTEDDRDFLAMGATHLPEALRPGAGAEVEVREDDEGLVVLNHLNPEITDVLFIPYSLALAVHMRLLHDKCEATWGLYQDGKLLPTPVILDPRSL